MGREQGVHVGKDLNRPAFVAVLSALLKRRMAGELTAQLEEFSPLVRDSLRKSSELRNRTILGHGFAAVDPKEVEGLARASLGDIGQDADPIDVLLGRLLGALAPEEQDPYELIVNLSQDLLRTS